MLGQEYRGTVMTALHDLLLLVCINTALHGACPVVTCMYIKLATLYDLFLPVCINTHRNLRIGRRAHTLTHVSGRERRVNLLLFVNVEKLWTGLWWRG